MVTCAGDHFGPIQAEHDPDQGRVRRPTDLAACTATLSRTTDGTGGVEIVSSRCRQACTMHADHGVRLGWMLLSVRRGSFLVHRSFTGS